MGHCAISDSLEMVSDSVTAQKSETEHSLSLSLNSQTKRKPNGRSKSEARAFRTQQWNYACTHHQPGLHHHFVVCTWQRWYFYYIFFCQLPSLFIYYYFFLGLWECCWCLVSVDFKGKLADVVLGFDSLEPYLVILSEPHLIFNLVLVKLLLGALISAWIGIVYLLWGKQRNLFGKGCNFMLLWILSTFICNVFFGVWYLHKLDFSTFVFDKVL